MAKKKVQLNINAEDLKKKLNIKDGYSPIKGVDYFDGKTPVKGVDYFDGEVPDTTELVLEASKMAQIELESKIPTISQIVSELPSFGAEVRDSLELLQGEDRLDKSAIRGLDDYDEISKLARQPKKEVKKYYNSTTPGLQNPVDYIQFNTSATPQTTQPGLVQWNATDETLDLGMPDGITLQIGQETQLKVRNSTGSTLLNGKPVYQTGMLGNRPTVAYAKGDAHATGHALGLLTQDISNNADGKVTTSGYVRNIDTTGTPYGETWTDGDELWLSKTVEGGLTNTEPAAPHHSCSIGHVVNAHATQGSILVRIREHIELEQLSDVDGSAPTVTGHLLSYNATSGVWDRNTYNITDYWKNDGTSTATGNWTIGSYEFTTAQINTPIVRNYGGNTVTFKNLLNGTLGIIDSNGNTWAGIHSSPLGTVSAPSYSFTGDLNTGIYSPSADILGITTGGVERARFTSTGAIITTASSATGGIVTEQLVANTWTNSTLVNKLLTGSATINQSGTAGFTLLDFSYSLNSVGSGETNLLRFSQAGSDYFKIAASGQVTGRLGSATIPTYSFVGDTNTGIFSSGADVVNITCGGTQRMSVSTSGLNSAVQFFGIAGTALAPAITFTTDTNTGIYSGGADTLSFSTGGSFRALIGSTGRLGIGTLNPGAMVDALSTTTAQFRATYGVSAFMSIQTVSSGYTTYNATGTTPGHEFQVGGSPIMIAVSENVSIIGNNPALYMSGANSGCFLTADNYVPFEAGLYHSNGDERVATYDPNAASYYYFNGQLWGSGSTIISYGTFTINNASTDQFQIGHDFDNLFKINTDSSGDTYFSANSNSITPRFYFNERVSFSKTAKLGNFTVATLPASPEDGDTAFVTDALAPSFLVAVVGGGTIGTPVVYANGSWRAF